MCEDGAHSKLAESADPANLSTGLTEVRGLGLLIPVERWDVIRPREVAEVGAAALGRLDHRLVLGRALGGAHRG